mmetsp:Transcript_2556/g.3657  ORF Transcript_2556/g.3657 Transcript_2556/m.3657 type:complete len:120 (+) Transcript_2556:307-666(+)
MKAMVIEMGVKHFSRKMREKKMTKLGARIGLIVGLFQRVVCLHSRDRASNCSTTTRVIIIRNYGYAFYHFYKGVGNGSQDRKVFVHSNYNNPSKASTDNKTQKPEFEPQARRVQNINGL